MKVDKEDYYSLGDVVNNIKIFLKHLRKRWLMLVLAALVGAGLGTAYYFIQKPKYEAVTTFILEEKSTGGGGIAGLASQFGFDLSSLGSGGSIFAGDNILDILKSKKVVEEVLLSQIDDKQPDNRTLADLYLEFSGIKEKWRKRPILYGVSFTDKKVPMSHVQDSVLNIIYDAVVKKGLIADRTNKKGTIIKVQITASNDCFAKLMAERLVEEASKMYLNIKTGTAQANIAKMQHRSDSLLMLLNNKSYVVAGSQPLDINPGIKSAIVPMEIATRDKTVLITLYSEVTKNLEASKLLLSQQTPIIQLLDSPGLSLYDNKKSIFFLVVVGTFVSVLICLAFFTIVFFFNKPS